MDKIDFTEKCVHYAQAEFKKKNWDIKTMFAFPRVMSRIWDKDSKKAIKILEILEK